MPEGPEIRLAADKIEAVLKDKTAERVEFGLAPLKRYSKPLTGSQCTRLPGRLGTQHAPRTEGGVGGHPFADHLIPSGPIHFLHTFIGSAQDFEQHAEIGLVGLFTHAMRNMQRSLTNCRGLR